MKLRVFIIVYIYVRYDTREYVKLFDSNNFLLKDDSITSNTFLFSPVTGPAKVGGNKVQQSNGNNSKSPDLKTLIANGITSEEELKEAQNNNFFSTGIRGIEGDYISGEQIQATTDKMAGFNNAYRAFSDNPTKETARNLKDEYLNAKDSNKSIVRLYKLVEHKVEKLLDEDYTRENI